MAAATGRRRLGAACVVAADALELRVAAFQRHAGDAMIERLRIQPAMTAAAVARGAEKGLDPAMATHARRVLVLRPRIPSRRRGVVEGRTRLLVVAEAARVHGVARSA